MRSLNMIFIGTVDSATREFPWVWAAFWALIVGLVVLVALGYRAGWFLPKYRLRQADPMLDKMMAKIFGPAEIAVRSRRQAQVVPRYQLAHFRSDGFKPVRVAFGRELLIGSQCVYAAQRDDGTFEDQVLVARGKGPSIPMSLREQINEFGRILAEMVRAFSLNAREVRASRGYWRARLQVLKQRYEMLYDEYRQRRAAGESLHTEVTQLTDFEVRLKDLNKRLDDMT